MCYCPQVEDAPEFKKSKKKEKKKEKENVHIMATADAVNTNVYQYFKDLI